VGSGTRAALPFLSGQISRVFSPQVFQLHHRSKTPTGDPRRPQEVKLAKRIKYTVSSRADIGDGTEEKDLPTGIFINTAFA
jgi:hypothetical protein